MPVDQQPIAPSPDQNLCAFADIVFLRLVLVFCRTTKRTQTMSAVQVLTKVLADKATKFYYVEMRSKMQQVMQQLQENYQSNAAEVAKAPAVDNTAT